MWRGGQQHGRRRCRAARSRDDGPAVRRGGVGHDAPSGRRHRGHTRWRRARRQHGVPVGSGLRVGRVLDRRRVRRNGAQTPSASLVDSTGEHYTTGSAFDANGNFYVTDDTTGDISEFSPTGTPMGQFATGLQNPLSLVFDSSGNLYVGQQTTPYVAEFSPSGQRLPDIGPLNTELYGDDWIDLSSDQCTLYYTTEGTDIMRYNKCTNTQLPNFNSGPIHRLRGVRGPDPRRRQRTRGGLRLGHAPGPERQRDPDLLLLVAAETARASCSPSVSTRMAPRSGRAIRSPATCGRSTSRPAGVLQTDQHAHRLPLRTDASTDS